MKSINALGMMAIAAMLQPLEARGQDADQVRAAVTSCIVRAIDTYDDGRASPESIFLATRHSCRAEESQLLHAFNAEFQSQFPDADPGDRQEFVFTMNSIVMQNAQEEVSALVLSRRVKRQAAAGD